MGLRCHKLEELIIVFLLLVLSVIDIRKKEIADIYLLFFVGMVGVLNYESFGYLQLDRFAIIFTALYFVTMIIVNLVFYVKRYLLRVRVDEDNVGFAVGEADMIIIAALGSTFGSYVFNTVIIGVTALAFILVYIVCAELKNKQQKGPYPMVPFILLGYLAAIIL